MSDVPAYYWGFFLVRRPTSAATSDLPISRISTGGFASAGGGGGGVFFVLFLLLCMSVKGTPSPRPKEARVRV